MKPKSQHYAGFFLFLYGSHCERSAAIQAIGHHFDGNTCGIDCHVATLLAMTQSGSNTKHENENKQFQLSRSQRFQ